MKLMKYLPILLLFLSACAAETEQRTVIHTDRAPEAGPYSQGILAGNTLYAAGQVGLDPDTREMVGEDLASQAVQALDNLQAVVEAAGMQLTNVISVQVFLADMDDYAEFNEIYAGYFPENAPARAVVEAARLPIDARVEIMLTAVR